MIPIQATVKRDHRISARDWARIRVVAWKAAGDYWHQVILPKKFTVAGAREYGYARRSSGYEKKKRNAMGHGDPLVFTGDLRRQVTRMRDVRTVSSRGGGAKVVLSGPRYIHQRRSNEPNKARELMAISERDARAVAGVMDQVLAEEMNRATRPETVRG